MVKLPSSEQLLLMKVDQQMPSSRETLPNSSRKELSLPSETEELESSETISP